MAMVGSTQGLASLTSDRQAPKTPSLNGLCILIQDDRKVQSVSSINGAYIDAAVTAM